MKTATQHPWNPTLTPKTDRAAADLEETLRSCREAHQRGLRLLAKMKARNAAKANR